MGAKSHVVVMPDANMDVVLSALVSAGFGSAVQKCTAISTAIFVGGSKSWYALHQCDWWIWFNLLRKYSLFIIIKIRHCSGTGEGARSACTHDFLKLLLYDLFV